MFGVLEAAMWLSMNIYHEARSEDRLAQLAIAHATLNRAQERKLSVKETIFQPKQYSWTFLVKDKRPKEGKAAIEALAVAAQAMGSKDFTGGATHYHKNEINPPWAKRMRMVGTYGSHTFYKERALLKPTKTKKRLYAYKNNKSGTTPVNIVLNRAETKTGKS